MQDAAAVRQMVSEQLTAQSVAEEDIPEALADAKAANPDTCAWLYVPGTDVSLPVMRHPTDDAYYSDHLADGTEGVLGTVFIERSASPFFIDPVTVVCGHAFEDQIRVMLGSLHAFESKEFV